MMDRLNDNFGLDLPHDRLLYAQHHVTHAASCFTRSGMDEALVIVMDGAGEQHSTTVFRADMVGWKALLLAQQYWEITGLFYLEAISARLRAR